MTPQEVNEYLAVNLMGWVKSEEFGLTHYRENGKFKCFPDNVQAEGPIWDPYHNITQALGDGGEGTVVGRMEEKGWTYAIHQLLKDPQLKHTGIFMNSHSKAAYANSNTPSVAICLAAVEALEMEKDKKDETGKD